MAKTINLTVNVDDTQFRAFTARYTAFSNQIGQLNNQFKALGQQIQNIQTNASALTSIMNNLTSTAKAFGGTIEKVTGLLVKWVSMIGGIAVSLMTGSGLFGLDRLATNIMNRRKLAMGVGGEFGRTQGAVIAGESILDNPTALMQAIGRGLHGSMPELQGLAPAGALHDKDPTTAFEKVIMNLWEKTHGLPDKAKVPVGQALTRGLPISPNDIVRISGMTKDELLKFISTVERSAKAAKLSDQAAQAWTDLKIQFEEAKVALESALGEGLKKLAPELTKLSKALEDAVRALMDSEIVARIINFSTKQLNKPSTWLKDPTKVNEALQKFDDEVKKWLPLLKRFFNALTALADILDWFFNKTTLERLQERQRQQDESGTGWDQLMKWWKNRGGKDDSGGTTTTPGTGSGTGRGPPAEPMPQGQDPNAPNPTPPATAPAPSPPGQGTGGLFMPGNFMGGNTQFASFGGIGGMGIGGNQLNIMGGSPSFSSALGGVSSGSVSFAGGNSMFASARGGSRAGISMRGGDRLALFSSAAGAAVPGDEMNAFRGATVSAAMNVDNRRGLSMLQGPLDVDNWQMNRTSSLVVRNVPGSNVFMQGTGMSG